MSLDIDHFFVDILNGDSVLFLGAGASTSLAQGINGASLPTGGGLASIIASKCGMEGNYALDTISEFFVDEMGESALISLLKENLSVTSFSEDMKTLVMQNWIRVWTTNYDLSFEECAKSENSSFYSMSTSSSIYNARGNRKIVVHINGKINDLSNSIPSDFILTSKDYATNHFLESDWVHTFRHDLTKAKSIIFIGYSMADIDIARIVFNNERMKNKVIFIDSIEMDPVFRSKLRKFGEVAEIGVSAFCEKLNEIKLSWKAPEKKEIYRSFDKIVLDDTLLSKTVSTDDDFYDLLLKGEIKKQYLSSPSEESKYTIKRKKEEEIYSKVRSGNSVTVINSSFANGKTILVNRIGLQCLQSGSDVFILFQKTEVVEKELLKMCERKDSFLLIIENYQRHLSLVEIFCKNANRNSSILLTERRELFELSYESLEEKIDDWNMSTFNIDYLGRDELKDISSLFSFRGLWGELDSLKEMEKIYLLENKYGGSLQGILLGLLESDHVKVKLEELVSGFKETEAGRKALITLCLLVAIGERATPDDLEAALNLTTFDYNKMIHDSELRQIFSISNKEIQFKSPVVAHSILRSFENAQEVTEVVAIMEKNLYKFKSDDRIKDICTSLIRFGTLEKILPKKQHREALQNLYEELKNIKHFSDDPLFWLQYAIARLTLGDTDKSRDYFKTALALSKTTGFKPYQIETHFCRQLLTEASDISNSDIAYKYSVEAFDTLKAQSLAQSRHHPFRASWGIEEVVYRHVEKWTPEQCKSLKNKIEFMQASADRLDPSIAKQKPVIGALQRYSNVIRKLDVRIKNEVLD